MAYQYELVLFDLDGTLTDSGLGIMNSVQYALKKNRQGRRKIWKSLNASWDRRLHSSFAKFCGFSDEKGHQMVEFYREYYEEKGMLENSVYDGIPEVLEQLKNAGIRLAVATSKPEKYARKIAEHFKIAPYFEFIGGANMDGSRTKKAEVIEYVLKNCKVEDRQSVLMVGDREHDILGAKACKVSALGSCMAMVTERSLKMQALTGL